MKDEAESVFLSAIASYPSNEELYRAAISFYEETKQLDKISEILEDCDDESVLSSLKAYVSAEPVFSLDDGKYSEVQEVTLSASGETIYYTTDGTDPTSSSTKYTEPILLNEEGKTQIKAIAYNKKKIPSLVVSKTYEIEFPVADAPVVTQNPRAVQYGDADQYYRAGRIHSLLHDRWFHADNRIFLVYRTDRDAGRTDAVQCSSGEQDRKNDTDNKTKLYLSAAVKAADFFR